MEIVDVDVDCNSGLPDRIFADASFEEGVVVQFCRRWDNPQWYVLDLGFNNVFLGIGSLDDEYPVPSGSDLHTILERSVDSLRDTYTPA